MPTPSFTPTPTPGFVFIVQMPDKTQEAVQVLAGLLVYDGTRYQVPGSASYVALKTGDISAETLDNTTISTAGYALAKVIVCSAIANAATDSRLVVAANPS